MEIDLLIIKKNHLVQISNEIGIFFKGHNIIEYKSPEDNFDIDVFYKTGSYASLYKSYGASLDERKAEDITVSISRFCSGSGVGSKQTDIRGMEGRWKYV